jgi:hypothetical protein
MKNDFPSLLKPELSNPDYGAIKEEFVERKVMQKGLPR